MRLNLVVFLFVYSISLFGQQEKKEPSSFRYSLGLDYSYVGLVEAWKPHFTYFIKDKLGLQFSVSVGESNLRSQIDQATHFDIVVDKASLGLTLITLNLTLALTDRWISYVGLNQRMIDFAQRAHLRSNSENTMSMNFDIKSTDFVFGFGYKYPITDSLSYGLDWLIFSPLVTDVAFGIDGIDLAQESASIERTKRLIDDMSTTQYGQVSLVFVLLF